MSEQCSHTAHNWNVVYQCRNCNEIVPEEIVRGYLIQLKVDRDEYRNLYHMAEAKVLSRDALLEQLTEEQLTQDLAKAEEENEALIAENNRKTRWLILNAQDDPYALWRDALLTGENDA